MRCSAIAPDPPGDVLRDPCKIPKAKLPRVLDRTTGVLIHAKQGKMKTPLGDQRHRHWFQGVCELKIVGSTVEGSTVEGSTVGGMQGPCDEPKEEEAISAQHEGQGLRSGDGSCELACEEGDGRQQTDLPLSQAESRATRKQLNVKQACVSHSIRRTVICQLPGLRSRAKLSAAVNAQGRQTLPAAPDQFMCCRSTRPEAMLVSSL